MRPFPLPAGPTVALLLCLGLALPAPSAGQSTVARMEGPAAAQQEGAGPRLALIPFISAGFLGTRWERPQPEASLRPDQSLSFGAAAQVRAAPTLSVELLGSYASTSYHFDFPSLESASSGELRLYRASAGVLWRMRADVPGYFSLGAGAQYYDPRERPGAEVDDPDPDSDGTIFVAAVEDDAQWMPSAHLGAGIELGSDDHRLRLDLRGYFVRPAQEAVESVFGTFERRTAFDFQGALGYMIRF